MNDHEIHVVTGAFGYSGKYIAKRLMDVGCEVRTLTNSPNRENPFHGKVRAFPFNFDNYPELVASLKGASALYNTYWVRFNHADFKHALAVDNTLLLFKAAKEAGVRRIVHISITNPAEDSKFEYFRGKAILERALIESGVSYAILRPAVLFGREDILIHNIAWCLRNFPVFLIPGDGQYRLQPIHVDDLAKLAVDAAAREDNDMIQAIGPETFTYSGLVKEIGASIGKARPILGVPWRMVYAAGAVMGRLMGDCMITRDEIQGLMADLLYVNAAPAGSTRLTDWAKSNRDALGRRYTSELERRRNRTAAYDRS